MPAGQSNKATLASGSHLERAGLVHASRAQRMEERMLTHHLTLVGGGGRVPVGRGRSEASRLRGHPTPLLWRQRHALWNNRVKPETRRHNASTAAWPSPARPSPATMASIRGTLCDPLCISVHVLFKSNELK